jgi:catechol 2,3-dioxygenase-like lactoylglutathione lyase family enzyme
MSVADDITGSDLPTDGVEITVQLVVGNVERSRAYYRDVVGATVVGDLGRKAVTLRLGATRLFLVAGSGPTPERPGVTFRPPADIERVSLQLTLRVPDCCQAYEVLVARGARFLAPPVEYEDEIRAFFRDPDGHLLEISQSTERAAPSTGPPGTEQALRR